MRTVSVSVIIPCYNSMDTVERAIESVFRQTLIPEEVILVDDCSPDNTLVFLYSLQDNYPKGWIKIVEVNRNLGAGSARNAGWDVATQKYIAFLDSDDSWHPNKIEIQYNWMNENPNVFMTGHNCAQVDSEFNGFFDLKAVDSCFFNINKYRLLFSNQFSTPTVMLKRELMFRFQEGKRYSEDYQLWLEIILNGHDAYKTNLNLAYLYKPAYGASGLSSHLWKMQKGELANYKYLLDKKLIGLVVFTVVSFFSLLKYTKRLLR